MGNEQEEKIVCRDTRRKQVFVVDDEYLNGYARLCGATATLVYISLCRHANKEQEAWPSMGLIMEEYNFGSKHTVIRAIERLEEWGIVQVIRSKDEKTQRQKPNVYVLVDKCQWKPKPGALGALGAGCTLEAEPGALYPQKPGARSAPEGYTHEGNTKKDRTINVFSAESLVDNSDDQLQEKIADRLSAVRDELIQKKILTPKT